MWKLTPIFRHIQVMWWNLLLGPLWPKSSNASQEGRSKLKPSNSWTNPGLYQGRQGRVALKVLGSRNTEHSQIQWVSMLAEVICRLRFVDGLVDAFLDFSMCIVCCERDTCGDSGTAVPLLGISFPDRKKTIIWRRCLCHVGQPFAILCE